MEASLEKLVARFLESESGATAIEYGFLMALLSMALVVALQSFGASLSNLFTFAGSTVSSAIPTSPPATPPQSG